MCTMPPAFVIPHSFSTLYRCSLTTVAQSKPYHEKPFNQRLLQPQGELYPIQTIINHCSRDQLLQFPMSFHETINKQWVSCPRNFKHTQFSRERWTWRDSNSQLHTLKASAVPIELTWLPLMAWSPMVFCWVYCIIFIPWIQSSFQLWTLLKSLIITCIPLIYYSWYKECRKQ